MSSSDDSEPTTPHRRRPRYSGKHPRRFSEKYKELNPQLYTGTVAKVLASGKTPAGTHRPIMVAEVIAALTPRPGDLALDCTLGYGGHARALVPLLQPNGHLLGLDADPIELPKTEGRLRKEGFGPEIFTTVRTNFAGLPKALATLSSDVRISLGNESDLPMRANCILADLGVSSMQLDDPERGFSTRSDGPLDMRMNPRRGQSAAALLANISPDRLAELFRNHADEPRANELATALASKSFSTTHALADAIRAELPRVEKAEADLTVRRVFQALRIAVNDEFSALNTLLRCLPACLNTGGRVAILTFHSGEDRKVKQAFAEGLRDGTYEAISHEVIRPTPKERHDNPRSSSAKLRWARRAVTMS